MGIFGFLMYMYYLCSQKKNKKEKEVNMKKIINTILLVVLGVSLSGCEWFEHENYNKKDEDGEESYATKLISCGGSGYIVLIDEIEVKEDSVTENGRRVSKKTVNYKSEHNDSIPIDIDVDDLKYDPNKWHENNIKIRVGCNMNYYNIGSGGGSYSGNGAHFSDSAIVYDGKSYVMEEIFKLKPGSDTLFIDFVCREDINNQAEIGLGNNRYPTPLTSRQIEKSIKNGNYEITYITLSWTKDPPRECYNIDGKMYTKSTTGDRWIYLANQYPPLGYMTSTNETHMIAYVKLKGGKGNGFDEYYKVSTIRYPNGYCSNVVRDKNRENPHITKSHFNN